MSQILDRPETFWRALEEEQLPLCWQVWAISSCAEVESAVAAVVAAMTARGYPQADVFETSLILDVALNNAVKHGNLHDPDQRVLVSNHIVPDRVLLEAEG